MKHTRLPLLGTALASVAFAACDGSGDGTGSQETIPADADLVVEAVPTIRWDKSEYTAPAGDVSVVVKQSDPSAKHVLAFVDSEGTQLPPTVEINEVGDVATETITLAAGTYTVICTVPGHTQMRAKLTVS